MPPEAGGGDRLRILLVEDHDLLAGALTMALHSRGIEAESTAGPTPDAVVEAARRLAPALVLLDLDLGSLGSGRDLIRPLADTGATVVMLTGVTDRLQLAACVEQGALGLLPKTIPFEELLDDIARVAAGEALLDRYRRQELLDELVRRRAEEHDRLAVFASLTRRERDVLARLMDGQSAEAVAAASYVSLATVRSQIQAILRKLGVNSQLAAVALAREAGWSPDR